jgi:hypothetical protein
MSDHSHALTPPEPEKFEARTVGMIPTACLGAAVIGIVGSLIGAFVSPAQFAHSWLFAFFYFFSLCAGALFWTILHHATDSEWSVVVRRQMENIASILPWFFLLLVPLVFFVPDDLWRWWTTAHENDALLADKSGYLNKPFFYIRYVLYFVALGGTALLLRNLSIKQDGDGQARHTFLMRKIAIAGLPAFAVALTFAAIDYLMALDHHWFSTMWGVYIFAGAAGSSMSLIVLLVTWLRKLGYLKPVSMEHYHIMGKYMLAFTIFWAYIGYSQYMLIWYANIPEETIYFRIRNTETWWYFSQFLVVGRFFLPFPVLLLQMTKKHPNYLCYVAWLVLFMQFIDMYVIVLPALHPFGFSPSILDVLAFVGVGGLVAWLWFRAVGSAPTFPLRDPRLAASIKLTN